MATAPPPPPLPSFGNQPIRVRPAPTPGHAAIPFYSKQSPPVQETSPASETVHHVEGSPASPASPMQNGPESPPPQGQEDNPSHSGITDGPEQETDPALQVMEPQDAAAIQMDQAVTDQLP